MSCDGFLPAPPCAESPFAQNQALPALGMMSCIMSDGVAHPSSLIRAHAPDQIPPAVFDLPITTGLCRLSPIPAGRWPFPILSLQSLRRCLDPYPAVSPRCSCSLLPRGQRPHIQRHTFGTLNNTCNATSTGIAFRGCSHSLMFRLPRLLAPQVAPTAGVPRLQSSRDVYTTHSPVGYLPRDVASLRIRHEQLIRLDFHQLDCSLVGRSDVVSICENMSALLIPRTMM